MKKRVLALAAVVAAICACDKQQPIESEIANPEVESSAAPLVFTATMECTPDSKATLDGMAPSWELGDEVSINAMTYVTKNAGTSSALVPKDPKNPAVPQYGYYEAVFPTSFASWRSFGGSISLTTYLYPEIVETYQEEKFTMPMYAKSYDNSFAFKNLCGVLKIIVKSSQLKKVKSIYIKSSNQYLSGTVGIVQNDDGSYKAVIQRDGGGKFDRKITYTTAVPTTPEGTVFYIAIPPNTSNGLTIKLSPDGETFPVEMKTAAGRNIAIERNKIYPITFAGDWGISGTATATIDGNEVDVPWVQLWKNGPKFAKYNVGVTNGKEESLGGHYAWGRDIDGAYGSNNEGAYLSGDSDTATKLWGDNWRMPTDSEYYALYVHCTKRNDVTYTKETVNGQVGYRFTGTGDYAVNSMFLPLAGESDYGELRLVNSYGYYWSSNQSDSYHRASYFRLTPNLVTTGSDNKDICNSVRAVYAPQQFTT